ncbi:flagellar hook-associated protein FlgK [Enterobacteriaceae bacterium LUAb1]
MNIFNMSSTGIRAASVLLGVTSLNIQNAMTPGYSRQRVDLSSLASLSGRPLDSGAGVDVMGIRRMADHFLIGQVWRGNTEANYFHQTQKYLGSLEEVIGAESGSLGGGLDDFFAALSAATESPDRQALRQDILTQAKSLTTRFNHLQSFMRKQRTDALQQQQDTVTGINTLLGNVADYNKKITESEATGIDTSVLRDQRDQLVQELSTYMDVRVGESATGDYTITMASGEPLVQGQTFGVLKIAPDASSELTMSIDFSGTTFDARIACGGQLGSLYDYMTGTLAEMEASVTSMASSMAEAFNTQLQAGFDLHGNPGKDLFVFNASDPHGMLQITDLQWDELAFSSVAGESGNNNNLKALINVKSKEMTIAGMGQVTLDGASATLISTVGIKSRQNQADLDAAGALLEKSLSARDNYSAVDGDEEALNLMSYNRYYQSNMKVISTGDELFSSLLALF